MERHGGTQAVEAVPADPVAEWASPGGETGLEESMWHLGVGGGQESYPERAGEPDCIYYVKTGFCGYGSRCRFNHPPDRSMAMGTLRITGGDYPERVGQPVCQYYMRTGTCKFGASCKYHHPKHGAGSSAALTLNHYGYPSRPGEKECSYYVKTGQCKFGITCKFHHPLLTGTQDIPAQPLGPGPAAPPAYPTLQSPLQSSQQYGVIHPDWPVPRPPIIPGSYVPGSYSPYIMPPPVLPVPGWTPYQAHVSPITSPSAQTTSGPGQMTAYTGPYIPSTSPGPTSSSQRDHTFPERPGEPECQYYLRTGDCKFGATCKYHHPLGRVAPNSNFSLSPMGLPLRPGAQLCMHYAQNGVCRFGPSCKYDHPMGTLAYSPSVSSLTDMPVTPYPVGSTNLRPGFMTDAPQMSSMNTTSASVGSLFSTSGIVPQQSGGQGTISSSDDNGTSCAAEVHTAS